MLLPKQAGNFDEPAKTPAGDAPGKISGGLMFYCTLRR
jgi:hypothetical protein